MEENKQTAVEWLLLNINIAGVPQGTGLNIDEVIDKAKEMEKEQTIEAWNDGNFLGRNGNILADYDTGERYYKETYGK